MTESFEPAVKKTFRAEKHNGHARVLAVRQSPNFEETAGISLNFVDLVNKKSYELSLLLQFNFPVSSNILTPAMESWCIALHYYYSD